MEMRALGSSLRIAPLVLGGNVFGGTADKVASSEILDRFADAGFQAIDTADVYSRWVPSHEGGESERVIGEWLKRRGGRDRIVIITKVGSDMGDGRKGLSSGYIAQAVDGSLARLQTDYLDVYLSHVPVPSVPYEETLGAFARLVEAGKVRESGASNLNATQLKESLDVARSKRLPRYGILQPEYNLYDRGSFEGPLQALTRAERISVITYFSLAKGFLTGKYRTPADLALSPRGAAAKAYMNEWTVRLSVTRVGPVQEERRMSRHSRDEDDAGRDAGLDETLAATFPASDPLSSDPNPSHPDEGARNAEQEQDERESDGGRNVDEVKEKPKRR